MENLAFVLLFQLILILLNAIFASAEIAVISISAPKVQKLASHGDKRAVRLEKQKSQPARFLATIQVAITFAGFLGSAFASNSFSDPLVDWLIGLGVKIPEATLNAIAVVVITIILSYFTLIFGELVPKRIAMRKTEELALAISGLISFISTIFAPIVWLLTVSTNGVLRLIGIDPNQKEEEGGEEDIRMMADASSQSGVIAPDEGEFINSVFEFDDLSASDIATHRTDLDILYLKDSDSDWREIIHRTRHSLYPVCGESADDIVGILNTKDLFRLRDELPGATDEAFREAVMSEAVIKPYFVPESVKADALFRNMKRDHMRMAVVLDEYGGLSGVVTLSDLVERLVGSIPDEDDAEDSSEPVTALPDGKFLVRGDASIDAVARAMEIELPDDDFDTFGGLIMSTFETIPDDGANVDTEAYGLKITHAEIRERRVRSAIVCPVVVQEEEPEAANAQ